MFRDVLTCPSVAFSFHPFFAFWVHAGRHGRRYHETISDVLSSVKKMEESLKRLKQARKTATSNPTGPGSGPTDDSKIRLQLALDVEYLGEQVSLPPGPKPVPPNWL